MNKLNKSKNPETMIKKLLPMIAFATITTLTQAQSFNLTYDFAAVAGTVSLITTDPTPPPTATGITSGSFTAVGTGTGSSGAGRFSFGGWPTGATNANDVTFTGSINTGIYYNISLTPQPSYGITYSKINFNMRRSGTGVRHYAVRSSVSAYTTNLTATLTIPTNTALAVQAGNVFFWTADATSTGADQRGSSIILGGAPYTNVTSPVSFRFYAWDAEGIAGTFSLDSVVISGIATFGAGVAEISHDINASFKLYPNPCNDGVIYIEPKNINYSKIEILNILGEVIHSEKNESLVNNKVSLDLNTLQSGVYFVRISEGAKIYTERFFLSK